MKKNVKKETCDVDQVPAVDLVLSSHPDVIVRRPIDTPFSRVQPTRYDNPVFYNSDSNTRYGDRQKEIGVCYVAGSDEVAIAETFQHGPDGLGNPVLLKDIEERSLFHVKAARELVLIDVGRLAAYSGKKLRDIVEAKGEGSQGYSLTQTLSAACMRHSNEIDGLIYTSTVFPAVSVDQCNVVLFEGRETQLIPCGTKPMMAVQLGSGETAVEFLDSLNVAVE